MSMADGNDQDDGLFLVYADISPDRQRFGEIVPRITGSISVISSMLIIFLAARSSKGFSSIYHRIMVGMSFMDILASTAMAFTHLPMPRPGISQHVDNYLYEGLRLGNNQTCSAQGFFISFGLMATYSYNTGLCVYYACAIFFKMKMRTIRNWVEPFIHASVPVALILIIPCWLNGSINPADAYCVIATLPAYCTNTNDCERGNPDEIDRVGKGVAILTIITFSTTVISLSLVCWAVFHDKRYIRRYLNQEPPEAIDSSQLHQQVQERVEVQQNTKTHEASNIFILFQAIAYIAALIITLVFPVIAIAFDAIAVNPNYAEIRLIMRKFQLVFQPTQGFFNFLIFLSSKVYQQRRTDNSQTVTGALKKIFTRQYDDPIFMSRLSIVHGQESSDIKLSFFDEENDEDLSEEDESDESDGNILEESRMEGVSHSSSYLSRLSWFSRISSKGRSSIGRSKGGSAVSSTGLVSYGIDEGNVEDDEHGNFSSPTKSNLVSNNNNAYGQRSIKRHSALGDMASSNAFSNNEIQEERKKNVSFKRRSVLDDRSSN